MYDVVVVEVMHPETDFVHLKASHKVSGKC
jgi:hypothetical protein